MFMHGVYIRIRMPPRLVYVFVLVDDEDVDRGEMWSNTDNKRREKREPAVSLKTKGVLESKNRE